jgi:hypothetical protein
MRKSKIGVLRLLSWAVLTCGLFVVSAVSAAPTVLTMPDGLNIATKKTYYAWAGKQIYFWGRVNWGPPVVSAAMCWTAAMAAPVAAR